MVFESSGICVSAWTNGDITLKIISSTSVPDDILIDDIDLKRCSIVLIGVPICQHFCS